MSGFSRVEVVGRKSLINDVVNGENKSKGIKINIRIYKAESYGSIVLKLDMILGLMMFWLSIV